jgi:glycosyl transferase family 25
MTPVCPVPARVGCATQRPMPDIRSYVINLDRAPDRLAAMATQLQALRLPYERIAAVDATNVTEAMVTSVTAPRLGALFKGMAGYRQNTKSGPAIYWPEVGRYFVAGEIACYLSHGRALQAFVDSGADAGLIFEDDAEIDADIADVIDVIDRLPMRPRIVKLEGIQASYETNYPVARIGERNVMMMLKPSTGAAAYYINRAGAEQLLPRLFPIREPFDAFLRQYWSHGVEVLETRPFPVRQRPLATMIPGRNEQRRLRLPLPYAALRGACMPALKLSRLLRRMLYLAKGPYRGRGLSRRTR